MSVEGLSTADLKLKNKKFYNQNFKKMFYSFLAYWHIRHVYQILWEMEKM